MTDNLETTGYWNFHNDNENSYAGNLVIDKHEITLTLLGCEKLPEEPFIVHGTTATGKKITLNKCFLSSRHMAFPGIPSVEITAILYFKGDHLSFDKLQFNSALLQISSLNYWVDIGGFEDFENKEETFTVKYKNPEPITFYITEEVKFVLLFQKTSPLFRPTHDCTVTQDTLILIKSAGQFDLDTFWNYVSMLNSFLTLAFFSQPHVYEIKFKRGKKILDFAFAGQKDKEPDEKTSRRNFLFTYQTIQSEFTAIFKKWSELHAFIEPVLNVLQESFDSRNVIAENKFLNVVQGIETFHRRRRKNEKVSKDVYKKMVDEIIETCPPEYASWLKEKLNFANEPTLKERLKELFNELDPKLIRHLFQHSEKLILDTKNSRNYYTHYDARLEKKALKGSELYYLTERLKILLLTLLLKETNIVDEKVIQIITEGSHFLFNQLIFKEIDLRPT